MGGLFSMVFGFLDSIFGGDEKPQPVAPPPPVFEPPPVMPIADDATVRAAKKKSIAAQVARRGRQSTILTQNDDAVGGSISGADNLGG